MNWQPIEMVPRDGTVVLCLRRGVVNSACWRTDWMGDFTLGGKGWNYPESDMPSHWMPMPQMPS